MKTVLYSAIRPAEGQTVEQVILQAQKIGYSMVIFNGYSDHDLGGHTLEPTNEPCRLVGGAHRSEAKKNRRYLLEITDCCQVSIDGEADWPHILQTSGPHTSGYIVK